MQRNRGKWLRYEVIAADREAASPHGRARVGARAKNWNISIDRVLFEHPRKFEA